MCRETCDRKSLNPRVVRGQTELSHQLDVVWESVICGILNFNYMSQCGVLFFFFFWYMTLGSRCWVQAI